MMNDTVKTVKVSYIKNVPNCNAEDSFVAILESFMSHLCTKGNAYRSSNLTKHKRGRLKN